MRPRGENTRVKKSYGPRLSYFGAAIAVSVMACESTPSEPVVVTPRTNTNVVTPKVTWPAQATRDDRAFASLGDAAHATELLGRSPVPVLAPTNLSTFEQRPTFVVGAEYYALTLHIASPAGGVSGGATIAITGKRAAHRYDNIAPITGDRALRNTRGFVSVNEGIRTSSWIENGAAYSIDIECADASDARCASDAFVVELIEHLGFAGAAR
jgi:hypothetical protein